MCVYVGRRLRKVNIHLKILKLCEWYGQKLIIIIIIIIIIETHYILNFPFSFKLPSFFRDIHILTPKPMLFFRQLSIMEYLFSTWNVPKQELYRYKCSDLREFTYIRGVKLIFTRGHISLTVAFKGPNVISTP